METGGLELPSTIILVLHANRVTKCASQSKNNHHTSIYGKNYTQGFGRF